MLCVILAGGLGLRLRPLTESKPKCLLEYKNKPLLQHQLEYLSHHNVDSVIISSNSRFMEQMRSFVESKPKVIRTIKEYYEESPLGTGGALKQVISYFKDREFLVINGDIITSFPLQELIKSKPHSMLLVPFRSPYGIVKTDSYNTVVGFEEKPLLQDYWINGGIYYFDRNVEKLLPQYGDIERATFPTLKMRAVKFSGFWQSFDTIKDLETKQ